MSQQVLSVTQINEYIRSRMDQDALLGSVAVKGEISNYKVYPSGHHYFTLKDEGGALKCVMFRNSAIRLKFTPENGWIKITINQDKKNVIIDIANNGTGIAPEDIPFIFDRFYKSDKSRGKDKTGAGLGLSFVKNILNLHGQSITVTSDPCDDDKMKTVFSFTLEKA